MILALYPAAKSGQGCIWPYMKKTAVFWPDKVTSATLLQKVTNSDDNKYVYLFPDTFVFTVLQADPVICGICRI